MEFLNYFLASIIVYLGLLAGIIISFMTKEELKPGKRYFILLHNIIIAFILFFILEQTNLNVYLTLFLPLAVVIISFIFTELYKKSYLIYLIIGSIFYLSSRDLSYFLIISTLILFYGFLIGTLQTDFKEKNYFKIVAKNLLFFICLVLYFI